MEYVPRLLDPRLDEIMAAFPAALLLGPRAVGKTTTARRHAGAVVELDDPAQAAQFRADPTAALEGMRRRSQGPLLLDEWQEVPEVLGAIKRSVDRGVPVGSYLLTGSVRAPLMSASWPGTGRLITAEMRPMTVLEQHRTGATRSGFISRVMTGDIEDLPLPSDLPDLVGYVDLALAGGFPPVVGLGDAARRLWLDSYVDQLVLRDAPELGDIRDPVGLRRLVRALAEGTGTLVPDTELATAVDMNVKTVRRHERLLDDLRIVTSLPAWHSNRLNRLIKQRKRYTVDTGLVSTLLEIDAGAILANGDLLGRVLESFVLAQLRPLLDVADRRVAAHHLRQQDGRREIDVVLEAADGRLVAIEVKASASPTVGNARHLEWLRDELPDRFTAGIVLHTGRAIYPLGKQITAVPIAALWG